MREISQETQEILKSQKMLGQNKFNYDLKLEGTEYYTDIKEKKTNTIKSASNFGDYCIRSDGKVLFAYLSGNNIYLSIIDSEEIMLSVVESGGNGSIFYTLAELVEYQCFTLIRLKNSKILLVVNDPGNFTNNIPQTIKVFESANGLGNDFLLKTIISTAPRISTETGLLNNYVAKPVQDKSGEIWIFAGKGVTGNNTDYSDHSFYKSIDGGNTWALKYNHVITTLSVRYVAPRSITIVENTIFMPIVYNYGTVRTYLYISIDSGENWQFIEDNFSNFPSQKVGYSGFIELLDWYLDKDGTLYMLSGLINNNAALYSSKPNNQVDYNYLNNLNNWRQVMTDITRDAWFNGILTISPKGTIHFLHTYSGSILRDTAFLRDEYSAPIKAQSISISKGRGGANSLNLSVDNSNGAVNPFNPQNPLYGIVGLNKQIILKQGYGADLIETFTGRIDTFTMKSFPHTLEIQCRDNLKQALDQTITESGMHTVFFVSQPIENIFGYLCYLAGIETGEIEATGINISKEFSFQSYADAFQFLADLASFEFGADEYGKVYFKRDFQPEEVFIAYTFEEGIDITSLSYELSDKDLYSVVKVFGKDGENVISYTAPFPDAGKYNLLPQKILKIDATEAATLSELKKIADRSIYLMNSRTAVVNFNAIAVPWLQVGDFIQVNESSSMSAGIYRISALNFKMDSNSFVMDLNCYYYGDSIETGTLPENTATQTANAELNLIPEMTSDTAPAGVARASSVLTLYENDYKPWNALNSHSDDLYWNAISPYGWIEYQFTAKTIVDKYILKARQAIDYNKAMPKNWTFEGFNGEKWIVLDTRTNNTAWGIHEVRSFNFVNTVAYSKYRLNVTANNGFYRLQLEQLGMFYRGGV